MKKYLSLVTVRVLLALLSCLTLYGFATPTETQANSLNANSLANEIDEFMQSGASGYLVWQYSGYSPHTGKTYFENDPFSFFREGLDGDDKICQVLKDKGRQYNDKSVGIGVNIWSLGNYQDSVIFDHLSWLKNNCNVKTIRIFAKAGGVDGVKKVTSIAHQLGLQVIVAIGDYSNGGGGMPRGATKRWYKSDYQTHNYDGLIYKDFVQQLSAIPNVFIFELANEPHCSGDYTALEAYMGWGRTISQMLSGKASYVGYGQMANNDVNKCDTTGPESPSHFTRSNNISTINITSAHYYNQDEKNSALLALQQSLEIGKPFYIGEAPPGNLKTGNDYDTSRFEDYNADDEKFYIQPIKGLVPAKSKKPSASDLYSLVKQKQRQTVDIQTDLIKQGYQAVCAAPSFKIELTDIGRLWMKNFLKEANVPEGKAYGAGELKHKSPPSWEEVGKPFYSDLTVDLKGVLYPVFRDVSEKRFLMTSLEEFFGYKDKIDHYPTAELYSGAVNSLTTKEQRCALGAINLVKQELMCQKLEDELSCALYDRQLPHSTQTVKQALEYYQRYVANHGHEITQEQTTPANYTEAETATTVCHRLLDPEATTTEKELAQLLLNTPLTIDRGYRLAFLVTKIELEYPHGASNFFNLFIHPNAGFFEAGPDKPPHAVLVVAFKIPDITTDKGEPGDNLGNTYWQDPADLTKASLLTTKQQQQFDDQTKEKVQLLEKGAATYLFVSQNKKDKIFCSVSGRLQDYQECLKPKDERSLKEKSFCEEVGDGGIGSPRCNDPLSRSLVNIINAQAKLSQVKPEYFPKLDCQQVNSEVSDTVNDPGSLQDSESADKVFQKEFGYDLLNQLFTDTSHYIDETGELDMMIASTGDEHRGNRGWLNQHHIDHEVSDHEQDYSSTVGWGLKSIFYIVPEMRDHDFPFDSCCQSLDVEQYLVYPEGYNLKTIEQVLAGSFFSQQQLANLLEKEQDYNLIQGEGDRTSLDGGQLSQTFEDRSLGWPNWDTDGSEICENDLRRRANVKNIEACQSRKKCLGGTEKIFDLEGNYQEICRGREITCWSLPCTRPLTARVSTKGQIFNLSYLGGKLGFWMRKTQQALAQKSSATWSYLESCQSTEDFLLGRCGTNESNELENKDSNCTDLSCGGSSNANNNLNQYTPPDNTEFLPENPDAGSDVEVQCPNDSQASNKQHLRAKINFFLGDRSWKVVIYNDCNHNGGDWGDVAVWAKLTDGQGNAVTSNEQISFAWSNWHPVGCGEYLSHPCDGVNCEGEAGKGTSIKIGVTKICASGVVKSNNKDNQCAGSMNFQVCRDISAGNPSPSP